jgi:Ca-activated chloride channel family protein
MRTSVQSCRQAARRVRPGTAFIACLAALMVLCTGSETPVLAQSENSPEAIIASHLGTATVIVVPQSGCVIVPHPHHPHPHHPRPRPPHVPNQPASAQITHVGANIDIIEQTARTTLDISLRNPSRQQIEAVILLPVPDGAAVSAFDFQGSASEPTAKVLSRDEARRLYEAIVRQVRDPALLEFAGYNLIRSSVFPIPAGGTQKVRLTYEHLLPAEGNRIDFALPRSESLARRSPWSIAVNIKSKDPISTIYSPSHSIITERLSPTHVKVSLTESGGGGGAQQMNPGPFLLSTLLERDGVSASLFAYPDPKVISHDGHAHGGAGYFLLMAGLPASIDDAAKSVKREVTIVIDRSGSMAGAKMDQARAAALQVVEGLADGEAFNIIDYSTTVQSFAAAPVIKDRQALLQARQYIEAIKPAGGTNIHDALLEAMRAPPTDGMLPIVLFLTDGLPTVGQTSEVTIRGLVEKGNAHNRRIFTFGVGNDVNVPLLDRVADITRANATYVLPQEDVELKVAAVFKRLYGPVLADLTLQTIDANGAVQTRLVGDMIPSTLPDLFEGDQLIVLGQYHTDKPVTFKLTGNFLGQPREFTYQFDLDSATTKNAFVPRLWAARRIAYLVDQIRQMGAAVPGQPVTSNMSVMNDPRVTELVDEILRLSTEFGILTEYTSFLATEGTNLGNWRELETACNDTLERRAVQSRAGARAINQGFNFNAQKAQGQLNYDNSYMDEDQREVTFASVQQMNDRAFFQRGNQWIDGRIAGQVAAGGGAGAPSAAGAAGHGRGPGMPTRQGQPGTVTDFTPDEIIEYGSPEHFALIDRLVEQNRQGILALEGDILLSDEGRTILVRNSSE